MIGLIVMTNKYTNIPDLEGYKINNIGTIINATTKKVLQTTQCNGYTVIGLNKHKYAIHRLVALTFIPKPAGKDVVNHINNDRTDNRIENLEWVTQKENLVAHKKCTSHPKRVVQMDFENKVINTFDSLKDAGVAVGLSCSAISKAVLKINNSAGGFKWNYETPLEEPQIDLQQGKQITNYEKYMVFPTGQIYNLVRKVFVKPIENASGHCYVTLCSKGAKQNYYVHRIVATHFLGNKDLAKCQVNHINKIKNDNRVENLEWITLSKDMKHVGFENKSIILS